MSVYSILFIKFESDSDAENVCFVNCLFHMFYLTNTD